LFLEKGRGALTMFVIKKCVSKLWIYYKIFYAEKRLAEPRRAYIII